jgi:hypothetical protein
MNLISVIPARALTASCRLFSVIWRNRSSHGRRSPLAGLIRVERQVVTDCGAGRQQLTGEL